jgi:hypothetical protein
VLSNVFAHAHLAAIGWASMMVVGVAYRLLPMVLPAAMPGGPRIWTSAVLLQAGVSGLFVTLLLSSPLASIFALTVVAGFAAFISQVWILRRPRPRPPRLRRLDPAVLHAGASLASLGIASVLGVWLTIAEASSATLRIAMAYGVFGLVGFLAQMVVSMKGDCCRSLRGIGRTPTPDTRGPVPSQYEMPWRHGQELVFVVWLFGVPALAAGLAFDAVPFVSAAAWCLFIATLVDTMNVIRILRYAFLTSSSARA